MPSWNVSANRPICGACVAARCPRSRQRPLWPHAADAEAYRSAEAQLEASSFTTDAGVLLAPDLSTIVARANTLHAQVGDAAAKQLP